MYSTIAIARARTALEELLRPATLRQAREDAIHVWSSVRPKLTLSGETGPSNRMARFARNIMQAGLPSPARYLEIGAFEGQSLAFVHALLKGRVAATVIDPFENYDELPSVDMQRSASASWQTCKPSARRSGCCAAHPSSGFPTSSERATFST